MAASQGGTQLVVNRGPGGKATLHDVAALAHVSVATVSNYVNSYPYMRESTKAKIQRAIDELGYVANASARNLRSGRTGLLSLSIPDLTQIYFAELAEEVITAARGQGYGVIVESTGYDKSREMASIASMSKGITDGLILSPVRMGDADIPAMSGNFPLVVLGERVFGVPGPHVLIRNVEAACAATDHLIAAGCGTIAVIGGSLEHDLSSRSLRTQGYRRALEHAGIEFDPRLVRGTGEWTSRSGAEATKSLLAQGVHPDGIFALNDLMAWGVISQLREFGIRIPGDVRVIGFDDIDESKYMVPSLTTVDPGRRQIAELSVRSIIAQVNAARRAEPEQVMVDYRIVFRTSSPRL